MADNLHYVAVKRATKKARAKGAGFSVEFAVQSTPGRRFKRTNTLYYIPNTACFFSTPQLS